MGQPKHLLDYGFGPQWKYLFSLLEHRFESIYISCRADQQSDFAGKNCILDEFNAIGPMGGIVSSMIKLNADSIFFVSCDLPLFQLEIFDKLLQSHSEEVVATCAQKSDSDFPEPLVAIWNKSALLELQSMIGMQRYSLVKYLKTQSINQVAIDSEFLTNVNTLAEFMDVKSRLKRN